MNAIPSDDFHVINAMSAAAYATADQLLPCRPQAAANLHEAGLILELWGDEGIIPAILSDIRVWSDLRRGDTGCIDKLFVPADRTKDGRPIEHVLSLKLGRRIGYHVLVFRPALGGINSDFLFPGGDSGRATTQQICTKAGRLMAANWLAGMTR
jgi:hypothetical protein